MVFPPPIRSLGTVVLGLGSRPAVVTAGLPLSTMRRERWSGQLTIAPGWALFVGEPGDNVHHSHQAVQICLSGGAPLSVAIGDREPIRTSAIAIAPNVTHSVASAYAALLYLDPHGLEGRRVGASLGARGFRTVPRDRLRGLPRELVERCSLRWSEKRARELRDRILGLWLATGDEGLGALDPRVEAAIRLIRGAVSDRRISAGELARGIGISESRLSSLFRQHTGVAIRPFVLWTRLQRAIETVGQGGSLTEAAHAAGFADSAHLSRTFRRMFGTTLSASVGKLRIQLLAGS